MGVITVVLPPVTIIKTFPKIPIFLPIGILGPLTPLIVPGSGVTISQIDNIPIPLIPSRSGGGGPPDPIPHGGGKPDPTPDPKPDPKKPEPDQNHDPGNPPEQEDPAYSWSVAFQNWCYTFSSYLNEKGKDTKKQAAMGPLAPWFAYVIITVPSNHIANADLKQYLDQWLFDLKVLQPLFNPTATFPDDDRTSIANVVTQFVLLVDWLGKLDSGLKWYGFMNNSAGNKAKEAYKTGGLHKPSDKDKPAEHSPRATWEGLFRNWRNNSATHMTALGRTETNRRVGVLNAELCTQMPSGTTIKTISRKLVVWKKDVENIADETKDLNNATSYDQPLQRLLGEQWTKVKTSFEELVKAEPSYTYSGDVENK